MSFAAKIIYSAVKLTGMKKKYSLPEEQFLKEVAKLNRTRGFYMPGDKKAFYTQRTVSCQKVLIVQKDKMPAARAILYFFGGGMMIGPDKGDVDVTVKLMNKTGCDIWFPHYPLCTEHCITDVYDMATECYRQMIDIYGGGNVSTCGFSSGGALALGVAVHNNAQAVKLPQPRHIVAVSPGEVPWNEDEEREMQRHNASDPMVDYAYMKNVEKFERHGNSDVPEYMIHISKGNFTGVKDIHFVWSEDEVLYGAKQNLLDACKKYEVNYTVRTRPGMIHCYPMLPYFPEAKKDFDEIAAYLSR